MKTYTGTSNQWSIGIGMRKSTIFDSLRWQLWITYGYKIKYISWSKNPKAPGEQ